MYSAQRSGLRLSGLGFTRFRAYSAKGRVALQLVLKSRMTRCTFLPLELCCSGFLQLCRCLVRKQLHNNSISANNYYFGEFSHTNSHMSIIRKNLLSLCLGLRVLGFRFCKKPALTCSKARLVKGGLGLGLFAGCLPQGFRV